MPRIVHPLQRPRGFTLIEVMVVVAIIVILLAITITVGMGVKANAAIRSTHDTLKSLEGLMKDYLAAGNVEPGGTADLTALAANNDMKKYTPNSDATRWVKYLRADANFRKTLQNLTTATVPDPDSAGNTTTVVLDAFGTPIRYTPYNNGTKKEGYFQSAGPDRQFDNPNPPLPPPPAPQLPADDLFSYDP